MSKILRKLILGWEGTELEGGKISLGFVSSLFIFDAVLRTENRFLDPDPLMLLASAPSGPSKSNPRFHDLNQAIAQLVRLAVLRAFLLTSIFFAQIEDHPLVSFHPLDLTSTESLEAILSHIDYSIQYGEDEEPKEVGCTPSSNDE
jgi:hypothetical protein